MIKLKIKQKIKNLKVNSVICLNFLLSILTLTIVYLDSFTITKIDLCASALTNKYKNVYFLPFVYATFNPNVTAEAEPLIRYSFSMFIMSLLVLVCFFNIIGYILSIYWIDRLDIEAKFPFFKWYIQFYSKTNKILLVVEIIIAFFFLLCIVILNFFLFTRILLI